MERLNDTFLLIGRLLMAALFLTSGLYKLTFFGYGGVVNYLGGLGLPYPEGLAGVLFAIEILVPIALILGFFPRITALVLIAFVIIATAAAHRFWEFPPAAQYDQMNSFLRNIAILGGLLFYFVSGPGAFSLAGRSEPAGVPARA
jgi:putative oxidoreductase